MRLARGGGVFEELWCSFLSLRCKSGVVQLLLPWSWQWHKPFVSVMTCLRGRMVEMASPSCCLTRPRSQPGRISSRHCLTSGFYYFYLEGGPFVPRSGLGQQFHPEEKSIFITPPGLPSYRNINSLYPQHRGKSTLTRSRPLTIGRGQDSIRTNGPWK